MPDFPAGTSFFAAHFASSSRFCHSFLHKQLKIFIVKGFQAFRMYGIIKQLASKIKFQKSGQKVRSSKINEICGMLLFVILSGPAVFPDSD